MARSTVTRRADGLVLALWLASALFIVYGTTLPFAFDGSGHVVADRLARLPFTTPWALRAADRLSLPDVVQNILLFVPFGVLGFLASRPGPAVWRVAVIAAAGALLSASVEVLQLFTADRISSLTDVITNTTGTAAGALAALLGRGMAFGALSRTVRAGWLDDATFYPMLVLLGVVALSAWQPFDVTLDVGTAGHKVRLLMRDPWQFDGINDEVTASLQAALFAGALCRWLQALGVPAPLLAGALASVAVTTGLEASQVIIAGRQPALASALFKAAGSVTGASLWASLNGRVPVRALTATVAVGSAAGAALQMLSPFTLAGHYQPVQWIPFLNYYAYTTFGTVSHTFELLLLYLPTGFFVGLSNRGAAGQAYVRGAVLAALIAVPIEYAQGWVTGRYPDVTDVLLSVAGACVGVWLATDGAARFAALTNDLGRR
ncbi:MAG: VanZ family protein [Vicinamibacterales bacterium]